MKITNLSVEKSFTLSLEDGYRKVSARAEAELDANDDPLASYDALSMFVTDKLKEEKAKFKTK